MEEVSTVKEEAVADVEAEEAVTVDDGTKIKEAEEEIILIMEDTADIKEEGIIKVETIMKEEVSQDMEKEVGIEMEMETDVVMDLRIGGSQMTNGTKCHSGTENKCTSHVALPL